MKKFISLFLATLMILSTLIIVPLTASAVVPEGGYVLTPEQLTQNPVLQQQVTAKVENGYAVFTSTADATDPFWFFGTGVGSCVLEAPYAVVKYKSDFADDQASFGITAQQSTGLAQGFTNASFSNTGLDAEKWAYSVVDFSNNARIGLTVADYWCMRFDFVNTAENLQNRTLKVAEIRFFASVKDANEFAGIAYFDEIPFTAPPANNYYPYKTAEVFAAENAAAAGVPDGFTGDYVVKLTGGAGGVSFGINFPVDFSKVLSFTIRVWIPATAKDFRSAKPDGTWITMDETFAKGQWNEITYSLSEGKYSGAQTFISFAEPFSIGLRDDSDENTIYVDSITFETLGDNVARGALVTTDGNAYEVYGFSSASVVDGVCNSAAASNKGWHVQNSNNLPATITLKLENTATINTIKLYDMAGQYAQCSIPQQFTIEASNNNGATWTEIADETGLVLTAGVPAVIKLATPVTANMIRFTAETFGFQSGDTKYTGLSEIELWGEMKPLIDPSWVNVALGGAVSTNNQTYWWRDTLQALTDGQIGIQAGWLGELNVNITEANPTYVTVVLPERSEIGAIKMYPFDGYVANVPRSFDIQVSSDGESWTTVASQTNATCTVAAPLIVVLDEPVVATMVRLKAKEIAVLHTDNNYYTGLSEFEVYGELRPLFDPSWVNVGMNASVEASNTTPWHDPNGLTNGTTDITGNTLWHASVPGQGESYAEITPENPATVELTLTDRSTVNAIRLYPMMIYASSSMPKAFTIEYSNDNGESWNQIASSVGAVCTTGAPLDFILDAPIVATNIRLVATEGGEQATEDFKGTGLTEFVVLGTPETANVHSASVTIRDDYSVNFKINKAKYDAVINTGATVTVDLACENGETFTNVAPVENGADYDFSFDAIGPHEFGDRITATITTTPAVGEPVVKTVTYSVAQYCADQLRYVQDGTLTKIEQVCVDLLNYGAAAQIAKGYKTEDLVNAGLADALAAKEITRNYTYTPADLATTGFTYSKGTADAYIEKANITLTNGVEINITVATTGATSGFSINGEALVFAGNKATYTKKISFTNLLANNTFELKNGASTVSSVTYGVNVYGSRTFADLDANFQALFAHLVSLGNSIAAYRA